MDREDHVSSIDAGKRELRNRRCAFCTENEQDVSYKDVLRLRRFVSGRGKIVPRLKSRVCAFHQRRLTRAIKRARILALLPIGSSKE